MNKELFLEEKYIKTVWGVGYKFIKEREYDQK